VPAGGGLLSSVTAVSPANAWAVGWTGKPGAGAGQQTLIEHWNGKAWTRVPAPSEGTASYLRAITVISADNAWAVGSYAADGTTKTMTLSWNGRAWTLVPSATPGGDAEILGGTATWTHNIWAVGTTDYASTLIIHWNGASWS
jgi:hypothetical protein